MSLPDSEMLRLRQLARIVNREIRVLLLSDERLHPPLIPDWQGVDLDTNPELAERVEAFVSRFARLQDTTGDKLMPRLLAALGEPVRVVIDNLARAETLGWLVSAQVWMEMRALRNQMVHEYMEDLALLKKALDRAHGFVPKLVAASRRMVLEMRSRGWLEGDV